jgi:LmbE family N-acetylglucosaminyl deacetylase
MRESGNFKDNIKGDSMSCDFKRVLALAPHADDMELGAGGTVARWVEEGKDIFHVIFSIAEKSMPDGFPRDTGEKEAKKAAEVLGIKKENLLIHRFDVRTFPQFRQDILELMNGLRTELKPDLVLLPSFEDIHQDHRTIAEEGIRAFKQLNVISYEIPWNMLSSTPSLFVTLHERHLEKKMAALKCYRSQQYRNYMNKEYIYALARTRGVHVNCDHAEAFEVIRWVMR